MPQREGSEAAGPAEWQYHSRQAGTIRRATNPKTGGHRPEKRPLRQVPPQVFFNPAGLFTHTLALPYGVLEVVLRGCGANFHGDVPRGCVVLGLVLNGKSSEVVALLSRCCPRTGQSQRVRSAGLMDTAHVGVKPTDGSRSLMSLFSTAKGIQGCHLWHETTSVHWGDTVLLHV